MAVFTGNGSAAAPSLTFSSDTDTGIFRIGANEIAISTDGVEKIRFAASGQIGLGGANYGSAGNVLTSNGPAAAPTWQSVAGVSPDKIEIGDTKAEVIDTGADGRFVVTTEGAERLRVTSVGNVGVNRTSPSARLDVDGNYAGNVVTVAALDIDTSLGNYFIKTINANSTFTFSNAPASRSYAFTLELTHTSGTVTWPAEVEFSEGSAPVLTTGRTHLFVFITDDGGSRWRGVGLVDYNN